MPTIWGLDPVQLHDRFWAAHGVCVVRPNEPMALPRGAHLFMLTDSRTLAVFPLRKAVDHLYWVKPSVLFIRLKTRSQPAYCEMVRHGDDRQFVKFERHYTSPAGATARIVLTRDRRVAERWQMTDGSHEMWRQFRRQTRHVRRETLAVGGRCYDRSSDADLDALALDLVRRWRMPSATVDGAKELRNGVWGTDGSNVPPTLRVVGRAWIGVGRNIDAERSLLGPAVLWDAPESRPTPTGIRWEHIEPAPPAMDAALIPISHTSQWRRAGKRAFDITFSLIVLALTLWIYPLMMLAIWLEDGRPFFFAHRRETQGGKEFSCLKFRSMRKDADEIKAQLAKENQSDGPQFFLENDPRVSRVGSFLRKTNLDELPQFINVLLGQMSVVGPRPSPRKENQCCPAWREARLSVKPGITGLWQVSRTRRQGLDFQEWIRFDVEYVEKANWRMDLLIVVKTFRVLLLGA